MGEPMNEGQVPQPEAETMPATDMPPTAGEQPEGTDEWSAAAQQLIEEAKLALDDSANASLTGDQRIVQLEEIIAERTDDLQRLQAEYMNYKRRVDRDRAVSKQQGMSSVVKELMPIMDAVATAAEHEEMTAGFRAVATELEKLATKMGLVNFGALGEEFDPNLHEALMQIPTSEYPPMTIAQVVQRGYLLAGVLLRPARVAVAVEPSE